MTREDSLQIFQSVLIEANEDCSRDSSNYCPFMSYTHDYITLSAGNLVLSVSSSASVSVSKNGCQSSHFSLCGIHVRN